LQTSRPPHSHETIVAVFARRCFESSASAARAGTRAQSRANACSALFEHLSQKTATDREELHAIGVWPAGRQPLLTLNQWFPTFFCPCPTWSPLKSWVSLMYNYRINLMIWKVNSVSV